MSQADALLRRTVESEGVRYDRASVLAAVQQVGEERAREMLTEHPNEAVSAVLGWNRQAVLNRVKHNALSGIAAFGLLPLAAGETVLDRYLALREVAKRGPKLGPNRRHSHAAAVALGLDHLAQVTGYPDAHRLEWDCESRLSDAVPNDWQVGSYSVTIRLDGPDPVVVATKAGKQLKSVPAAVRAEPAYQEVRAHQERLREQARRMRTGLVERLVASGGTLAVRFLHVGPDRGMLLVGDPPV